MEGILTAIAAFLIIAFYCITVIYGWDSIVTIIHRYFKYQKER